MHTNIYGNTVGPLLMSAQTYSSYKVWLHLFDFFYLFFCFCCEPYDVLRGALDAQVKKKTFQINLQVLMRQKVMTK